MAPVHAPQSFRSPSGLDYENGCDFFCLRFGVWYASADCAYRTRFKTFEGCRNCDQGRFNLKRHAASLPRHATLTCVEA